MNFTSLEKQLINHLQKEFPVCHRPFQKLSEQFKVSEQKIIAVIEQLLDKKVITRFGPLFDIEKLGGAFCLCAISVPEDKWQETAQIINNFEEVAHNYLRENIYNLWFVLATESEEALHKCIRKIEHATGYSVLTLPKLKEYFVGLYLEI